MCVSNKFCICHRLKPAIQNDTLGLFLTTHFEKRYLAENYHFLKDSYEILDSSEIDITKALANIVLTYLVESRSQQINIDRHIRESFIEQYDQFKEGEGSQSDIVCALTSLVSYVEKDTFQNLAGYEDFYRDLAQAGEEQQPVQQVVPNQEEGQCCTCILL